MYCEIITTISPVNIHHHTWLQFCSSDENLIISILLATFKYALPYIKYSLHAAHYSPMPYSFYNWKCVPLAPMLPISYPPPQAATSLLSVLMSLGFFKFCFVF